MKLGTLRFIVGLAVLVLLAGGCGSDDNSAAAAESGDADRPSVVVSTSILGDVVTNLVGEQIDVVTIMPAGADPHDFQASAQQVAQIGEAELLIVNGSGFEEGLLDVIDSAEGDGVPVFEATSEIATLEFGDHDHAHEDKDHADENDHADEDHNDENHSDEDDHADEDHEVEDEHADEDHEQAHEGADPHFFTDPARMAVVADGIVDFLVANTDGIDADSLRAGAQAYIDQLEAVDAEVEAMLAEVPDGRRVLVTNHEVFAYFADRYGFEVAGVVIPSGTTADGSSAAALAELAETIEHERVPAIFADTSSSDDLAQTLAAEVGDIMVIELFSESLGPADSDGATYLAMVRTNAARITAALAG